MKKLIGFVLFGVFALLFCSSVKADTYFPFPSLYPLPFPDASHPNLPDDLPFWAIFGPYYAPDFSNDFTNGDGDYWAEDGDDGSGGGPLSPYESYLLAILIADLNAM